MKKNKWKKTRHIIVVTLLRPLFRIFFKFKYNLKAERRKLPLEGSIILSNHTMTLDPFVVGVMFNKNLYYMASKDLFQKKFVGRLIEFLVRPIPKEKSNKGDLASIKYCLQIAKENGHICIFPEGNRTFSGKLGYVDPSIVKLIKMVKKPLIICNVVGGYSSDPRWSKKGRKGQVQAFVRKELSYDEYKDLSNDELYEMIINNLYVNDFEIDIKFKGNNRAEYLERILYICPICKKKHTISTIGNYIVCKECGCKIEYGLDKLLTCSNDSFKFRNVLEWYDYQINELYNEEILDNTIIYQDDIHVYEPQLFKRKKFIGSGKINMYSDNFTFKFDNEDLVFDFNDIYAITLVGKKKMNIFYKDKVYQLFYDERTNLIKYMHLFYIIKNMKEGIDNGFIGI